LKEDPLRLAKRVFYDARVRSETGAFQQADRQGNRAGDHGQGNHAVPAGQHVQLAAQHRPQRHPNKHAGEQQGVEAAAGLRLEAIHQVLVRHQAGLQTKVEADRRQGNQRS
jgi:hypothetical protein